MCLQVLLGLETEQENREFYQLWMLPVSIWPQQLLFSGFDTSLLDSFSLSTIKKPLVGHIGYKLVIFLIFCKCLSYTLQCIKSFHFLVLSCAKSCYISVTQSLIN